jgi:GYF domain 2
MKQYFLHDGQNQLGPFSPEELKGKNITSETFVWKEGMSDWVKANEIEELRVLLINTPPPFKAATVSKPSLPIAERQNQSGAFNTGSWIGRNWRKLSLVIIIGIVAIILYNYVANQNQGNAYYPPSLDSFPREKTPEELRLELQMKERENPKEYLKAYITRRKNLIGENVFEGTITNNASAASFKDITVKIFYLSKTRSVIGYHDFTVYEIIGPNQTVEIKKVKYFAPNDTDEYKIDIVSAIAVD